MRPSHLVRIRQTLFRRAVRPQAAKPAASAQPKARISPWGLAFVLGGLAFASWLAKPDRTPPKAAFDPIKRSVCVVFVFGDDKGAAAEFARQRGFALVDLHGTQNPSSLLDPLVKAGKNRFIVKGIDPDSLSDFENSVVQCDIALDYSKTGLPQLEPLDKSRRRAKMADASIQQVLEEKNLL